MNMVTTLKRLRCAMENYLYSSYENYTDRDMRSWISFENVPICFDEDRDVYDNSEFLNFDYFGDKLA